MEVMHCCAALWYAWDEQMHETSVLQDGIRSVGAHEKRVRDAHGGAAARGERLGEAGDEAGGRAGDVGGDGAGGLCQCTGGEEEGGGSEGGEEMHGGM